MSLKAHRLSKSKRLLIIVILAILAGGAILSGFMKFRSYILCMAEESREYEHQARVFLGRVIESVPEIENFDMTAKILDNIKKYRNVMSKDYDIILLDTDTFLSEYLLIFNKNEAFYVGILRYPEQFSVSDFYPTKIDVNIDPKDEVKARDFVEKLIDSINAKSFFYRRKSNLWPKLAIKENLYKFSTIYEIYPDVMVKGIYKYLVLFDRQNMFSFVVEGQGDDLVLTDFYAAENQDIDQN